MTPKERILAIRNRQTVDRITIDLWHTPETSIAINGDLKILAGR
jgi:hypothetical protein